MAAASRIISSVFLICIKISNMSRATLVSFLEKLDKELRGSSTTYRRETADRQTNTFVFYPRLFVEEIRNEFKFRELLEIFETDAVMNFVKTEAYKILSRCNSNAKELKGDRRAIVKSNQHYISVTLEQELNEKQGKNFVNFKKLQEVYQEDITKFVLDLNEFVKKQTNGKSKLTKVKKEFDRSTFTNTLVNTDIEVTTGSDLVEGGHLKGQGVLESRVRDAVDIAINENYSKKASQQVFQSNMKALGIDLSVMRDDDTDTMIFTAESRVGNQTGGFKSSAIKSKLQREIKAALIRLNNSTPIKDLKGSDTFEEKKTKETAIEVISNFDGIPGVTTTKPKKPKKRPKEKITITKTGKVTKKNKPNIKTVKVPKIAASGAQALAKARTPRSKLSFDQMGIMAKLNSRLPAAIIDNMGDPALNNRTGRFAASVRILNIIQTPKGFPSIGYTYLKNPYQTFETGYEQGDTEKDPRKLIDRTIRELAVEYAMGRLFTRRL